MDKNTHGVGWFYSRWQRTFNGIDKEKIEQSTRQLIDAYPQENEAQLARRVIGKSCRVSAVAGVVSAAPALVPGIGTAVSVLSIVPEEIYLIQKQCEMLLGISVIYGFDPKDEERLYEIVSLIGATSRNVEALMVAKYDLRRMAAKTTVHLGAEAGSKGLLGKTAGRGAMKRLPALGFLVGGGINYFMLRALGKKAIVFYAALRDRENQPPQTEKIGSKKKTPQVSSGDAD